MGCEVETPDTKALFFLAERHPRARSLTKMAVGYIQYMLEVFSHLRRWKVVRAWPILKQFQPHSPALCRRIHMISHTQCHAYHHMHARSAFSRCAATAYSIPCCRASAPKRTTFQYVVRVGHCSRAQPYQKSTSSPVRFFFTFIFYTSRMLNPRVRTNKEPKICIRNILRTRLINS